VWFQWRSRSAQARRREQQEALAGAQAASERAERAAEETARNVQRLAETAQRAHEAALAAQTSADAMRAALESARAARPNRLWPFWVWLTFCLGCLSGVWYFLSLVPPAFTEPAYINVDGPSSLRVAVAETNTGGTNTVAPQSLSKVYIA
jgi:multidrug efflux pump subunit AcrA (membrane-fusion protein)